MELMRMNGKIHLNGRPMGINLRDGSKFILAMPKCGAGAKGHYTSKETQSGIGYKFEGTADQITCKRCLAALNKPPTLSAINYALGQKYSGDLRLEKGKGYFYFSGEIASRMYMTGIYSVTLEGFTVEEILKIADRKIAGERM